MNLEEMKKMLGEKEQLAIRSDKIKEQLVGQVLLLRDQIAIEEAKAVKKEEVVKEEKK